MLDLALVYNRDIRHNGSPAHIWHAFKTLSAMGHVAITSYSPHGELPKHDFYLYLDDGRDDIKWTPPRPCGFWAVDTHLGYEFRRWRASKSDLTWCAQIAGAEKMSAEGIKATWLPLACNPMAHPTAKELHDRDPRTWPIPQITHDIGWVGYLQPPEDSDRIEWLDKMFKAFPNFTCGFGVFHEDAARILHTSRLALNHSIRGDLNMRFFEVASMGVPQLAPMMDGVEQLGFRRDTHFAPYGDPYSDAVEVARFFLKEPELLAKMALEALDHVRANHTYLDRARVLVADILAFLGGR